MYCDHVRTDAEKIQGFIKSFCPGAILRIKCPFCETYYDIKERE